MVSYAEQLEQECKEIEQVYPEIQKIIDEILRINRMSNMEFDYHIERKNMIYNSLKPILNKIKYG